MGSRGRCAAGRKATMEQSGSYAGPSIFPEIHYDDARAGIAFLERAFGFETHLIVPGERDNVVHAEMRVGDGFVLLGSLDERGRWPYRTPRAIDGVNTGGVYTAMSDVDALYTRAKAAGAHIVRELDDTDYGSREFSACDPEGFLWHFGTYHPTADGSASGPKPEIFGGMRYRNARAAIAWLIATFGFEENFVVLGEGDEIAHAQLRLGNSLLMLGSAREDELKTKTPHDLGGAFTQTLCAYVADPDAHHARAKAAGANIVDPLTDTSYGARSYVVRDPEGYVWTFSTYHPAVMTATTNAR